MALTHGTRSFLSEAASWCTAAAILAGGIIYHSELKALVTAALPAPTADVVHRDVRPAPTDVATPPPSGRTVRLTADRSGHFQARAYIDGRATNVMVDTGATVIALTHKAARRAGYKPRASDYTASVKTANGIARVAPVTLRRVELGGIELRNVKAVVSEPGKLSTNLLGMSFLSRLKSVDMRSGNLLLRQ